MGLLTFENGIFIFKTQNEIERIQAKKAGFYFDKGILKTDRRKPACTLRRFADKTADRILKQFSIVDLEAPKRIPLRKERKPYAYQLESVRHILTRSPAYVADDPGLGKSAIAITAHNAIGGRVLVICPPSLSLVWEREFHKWSTDPYLDIEVMTPQNADETAKLPFVIVPDSIITQDKVRGALLQEKFTFAIVDEVHRFKNMDAQRTRSLLGEKAHKGLIHLAERKVFLSGTPIPNGRPIELFPLLNKVAPEVIDFMDEHEFGQKYCQAHKTDYGWNYQGAKNLGELHQNLYQKFMIAHRKDQVLTDLPPKTRQVVFLSGVNVRIQTLSKQVVRAIPMDRVLEIGSDEDTNGEGYYAPNKKLGKIATFRRELGLETAKKAIDFIEDIMGVEEKLVIFAIHRDVIEYLRDSLAKYSPLTLMGGLSTTQKQKAVDAFQNSSQNRIIIGNIFAMGVGYTLTRAKRVVFVEASWQPAENNQAEDRIHRISQKDNVFAQYLTIRGSLSEYVLNRTLEKQANINQIMGVEEK